MRHLFDTVSGEYLGSFEPSAPDYPENSTKVPPPSKKEGKARCWNGEKWEYVPDHRGTVWYDPKPPHAARGITSLGEEICLVPEMPESYRLELETRAIRKQRNMMLAATDWTQATDVPEATREKYAAYRQALRDVPSQPGFPRNIEWPEPIK